jgi:pSer/pThr/pTyr-binding forkhead associated (FHA) protein
MKLYTELLHDTQETTVFHVNPSKHESVDETMNKSLALTAEVLHDLQTARQNQKGQYLTLYILTRQEPVFIPNKHKITLGRTDGKHEIHPTLDLTHDFARELGVSRLHAEIVFDSGLYLIQDLGSSNGTWVNENRLAPFDQHVIDTGDSIRLGHLIIQVG